MTDSTIEPYEIRESYHNYIMRRDREEDVRQLKWDNRFMTMAELISAWSKDPSSQIGAVIVNDERRILATGYNGFPRGIKDTEERLNDRDEKYPRIVHAEMNALITPCIMESELKMVHCMCLDYQYVLTVLKVLFKPALKES